MTSTMEASLSNLALAGNYFADGTYLQAEPKQGTLRNRGGVRLMAVPDHLLVSVHNAAEEVLGPAATGVLTDIGHRWGQRAAALFTEEMQAFYRKPLAEMPFSMALAALREALRSHGWGILQLDPSRYAHGILTIVLKEPVLGADVRDGARRIENLTAGFLAGFLSTWACVELDCLQTSGPRSGATASTFVVSLPERLGAVADLVETGRSHDEVVAKLESVRVA